MFQLINKVFISTARPFRSLASLPSQTSKAFCPHYGTLSHKAWPWSAPRKRYASLPRHRQPSRKQHHPSHHGHGLAGARRGQHQGGTGKMRSSPVLVRVERRRSIARISPGNPACLFVRVCSDILVTETPPQKSLALTMGRKAEASIGSLFPFFRIASRFFY
ncbi:hypothetical protein SAMN05660649_04472 [Desulfotomaculum arcticum]|uniref:Uncharacterized protein n=1 Tax=Desulfotruncus arcticus DSM 17038 TaxID=1121424 RepID=A0A1I2YK24_9FIRM|nr:hypothetical protein [Desulfotruncus arcticus]SFH25887.1 hypothetical protein SAMN05660649_04472 [Desulfotomaculum arcticum] [Desulfotruncus arcticus DSM 17038]